MLHAARRFRALSATDRLLVAEAAALLTTVRVGAAALPFPLLRHLLDRYGRYGRSDALPARARPVSRVDRVVWAVSSVARRLPMRTTCLFESLAADAMLRRRGYVCEIRFGVRPGDGGALAAHAWVECQGVIVLGAVDDLRDYAVLSSPERS